MSCFRCFGAQPNNRPAEENATPPAVSKTCTLQPVESTPTATRRLPSISKVQAPVQPLVPQAVPPVVLILQRQLAALQGTWISRVDMALKYTMECTGATAVSLSMLSQTHDCFVVLARRGPQHLVLPPGSCIAITEPGEAAQSLENPEQHSLQHLYTSSISGGRAAVIKCVPYSRGGPATMNSIISATVGSAIHVPAAPSNESLPLDWAHLHAAAGITHFAALPLFHGPTLAGALTILGSYTGGGIDSLSLRPQSAAQAGVGNSVQGAAAAMLSALPAYLTTAAASNTGLVSSTTNIVTTQQQQQSNLEALFRAPLSLELVAMAVAQCCLGADMALARHAVEMVQAMHACASIQQLVAGISLGLQALMHARFCLTLRCNVALAVEFQPNAIMFEESLVGQQPSGSGTCDAHLTTTNAKGYPVSGRPSAAFSSPAPDGRRELASRMASGGLVAPNDGTASSRAPLNTMRSGVDTTGEPMWGASSGHVTASVLLNQIVGRRYKARPFSVYHTLLIRTIHELAASSYGGTVITQCHDHMQDAKTPSRDIYALGRGVGQPPQSLVLSVTHLRPADEALPEVSTTVVNDPLLEPHNNNIRSTLSQVVATTSSGETPVMAGQPVASPDIASSPVSPASVSAIRMLSHPPADSSASQEPRTYIGLYMTSAEPLPAALLELILVEVHSLACHVLSPLVHRKLLVGELLAEWSVMQIVTSSSLPNGGNSDSNSAIGRTQRMHLNSTLAAGAAAAAGAGGASAAAGTGAGTQAAIGASTPGVNRGNSTDAGPAPAPMSTSAGSNLGISQAASSIPEQPPGGETPSGAPMITAKTIGTCAPNSRLSSLQRIMAPFLMADMAPADHTLAGTGVGASGGGIAGRRSSDVAFANSGGGANGGSGAGSAPTGNGQLRAHSPGVTASTTAGIRRILAFDAQGGKTGAFSRPGRGSMSASEGLAREMLLAAAASNAAGQQGDKYLSTEVATVQDTHSQMGLLVTSYKETLHNMHMELSVGNINRQSLDLHADDPSRLVLREVLGKGGHGVVFRGTMHSLEVAIKVFQTPGEDEPLAAGTANRPEVLAETLLQRRRVLTRAALELAIMSSISHPNIVQVYAQWPTALLERDETQPCRRRLRKLPPDTPPPSSGGLVCAVMVMEYCDKGTLVDAINRGDFVTPARDGNGFKANYKAIYTTMLEVALALRHLASMAVTHCDVKPANILLRSSPRDPRGFTAKLADFGYAALLRDSAPDGHRSVVTDEACGTVTHMAPESFVEGEPVDSSADVYAFGILMWELISGKQPYHDRNLKQLPHEVVNKGLRPTFPPNTPDVYKALAKSCWSPLPRNRPTAAQVVQSIQAQLDKIEAVARLLGKS